ncbi:MAG: 4-hydroxy-tetrahydrodipicolinate reductase [Desulfovibrio sp.]|jgi:4-hydroxy-tetrahydrodipicolinate reductase|nr:4-hydroxy-tetrahydrodipicolinate reductase [Desulfovibrio sp.]
MGIPVIVMGAAGRMGDTVARLVREAPDLSLAGVAERPEFLDKIKGYACPRDTEVRNLLRQIKDAVIVDFTAPAASLQTARAAAEKGVPQVIGTTGFSPEEKAELEDLARQTTIFHSPNMSVGVNALFKVLPLLARALGEGYDMEICELHHNKKKDAPSGTALRMAECLAAARDWKLSETIRCSREGLVGERPQKEIGVQTLRGGDVVGVHNVYFLGMGERIEVTHQAHSRDNFAAGALFAVRRVRDLKPGKLYSMGDILE